jgi:hypothetical protein
MKDYASNSHKSKKAKTEEELEEKKIDKVVTGKVKTKKKTEMQKFANVFISEDVGDVKSYIFMDVLVPSIKKAISDIIKTGIDMVLYGDSSRGKSSSASKISYNKYSDKTPTVKRPVSRTRGGYIPNDIFLDSRGEAEEVLERMDELIATYGLVNVADLYDLVGVDGHYTDNKYGWTDIRKAYVDRTRDGYLLRLPKVLPLD